EAVEAVKRDDARAGYEAGAADEIRPEPIEEIIEAPNMTGAVELRLPHRRRLRVRRAESQRILGVRAAELRLEVVHAAEYITQVARDHRIRRVARTTISHRQRDRGVSSEIAPEPRDVEQRLVTVLR